VYLKIELTDAELRLVISCDITAVRRTDSRINDNKWGRCSAS